MPWFINFRQHPFIAFIKNECFLYLFTIFHFQMVPRQLFQSFSLNQSLIFIAEHKPDVLVIVAFLYSILSQLQNYLIFH